MDVAVGFWVLSIDAINVVHMVSLNINFRCLVYLTYICRSLFSVSQ